ncbi:bifunctional 2-polyprenyl-6-hydroxyphenol methylase/3-demethylubiquinol 3-O-methyltransferase UbiG [Mycolicibacterium sp. F2034L]|uniref:class I SAM-dependent methyltransferase n=1 Tax=Mycolicibacterium sp. F2034L TaxID=2926422 RepID=UPI001FF68837|nr:class I SAM-dependent methyltransferase [Mycolicibacterium sp. F2034L]MCK0172925.1 class I SAM-dependent methyltransferase [Mycolicibacterium sp. F2034L]
MTADPRADIVAHQYEQYRYPEPIQDLETWTETSWQWFDPSHAHRVLWPDREYKHDVDILIAGCGTNQAAVFAYNNRDAKVLAVDVSQPSLDHQQYLKDKHGLSNLELRLLPIEELPSLGQQFDLVVSTGVLHHMADPLQGMRALAECVRPDGAIGIMLYAKYGRLGVEIMQSVCRDLDLGQNEPSVRKVRQALELLPSDHPVRSYMRIAPDLKYDAGLVDTFLHGRDRNYTVDDCLELVADAGLVFQDWFLRTPYYMHEMHSPDNEMTQAVHALPREKHWSVMERLQTTNGCHFFIACRPERPKSSYTIDFSKLESLDYVPSWRIAAGTRGDEIFTNSARFKVTPVQAAIARNVDGESTIRQIAAAAVKGSAMHEAEKKAEKTARKLFEALWRLDGVAVALP